MSCFVWGFCKWLYPGGSQKCPFSQPRILLLAALALKRPQMCGRHFGVGRGCCVSLTCLLHRLAGLLALCNAREVLRCQQQCPRPGGCIRGRAEPGCHPSPGGTDALGAKTCYHHCILLGSAQARPRVIESVLRSSQGQTRQSKAGSPQSCACPGFRCSGRPGCP